MQLKRKESCITNVYGGGTEIRVHVRRQVRILWHQVLRHETEEVDGRGDGRRYDDVTSSNYKLEDNNTGWTDGEGARKTKAWPLEVSRAHFH